MDYFRTYGDGDDDAPAPTTDPVTGGGRSEGVFTKARPVRTGAARRELATDAVADARELVLDSMAASVIPPREPPGAGRSKRLYTAARGEVN